jgi:hypothetical protein
MHNEKMRLLEMLANIPGIGGLDIPIDLVGESDFVPVKVMEGHTATVRWPTES